MVPEGNPQVAFGGTAERDEILRRAGVSVPLLKNPPRMRPAGLRRPGWLAFLLRLLS
jgi:hypothetical protein